MASCEFGQIAGGTCGPSVDNPANVNSITLAKCTKAIQGHLRSCNVRDTTLDSEQKLLLARAGMLYKLKCVDVSSTFIFTVDSP